MQVLRFYKIRASSTGSIRKTVDSILVPNDSHLVETKEEHVDGEGEKHKQVTGTMKKSHSMPIPRADDEETQVNVSVS
jgi:hypothetical protein